MDAVDLPRALAPEDIRGLTITQLDAFLDLVAATVLADGQISEGERQWVEQRLVHGAFAGTDIAELYRHLDMSLNHFRSHGSDLTTFVQMAKAQLQPYTPQLAEKILLALVQISESDKQTAETETAVVRAVSAALGVAKERMSVVVGAATGAVIFPPIARGDLATVTMLLDHGTSVETRDHNQWTPLHVAVATGQEAIVDLLLARGAPVDAVHAQGSTPLFCGCNKPYAAIVKKLLARGANPDAQNPQTGQTPLAVAIGFGQDEVVAALLAGGAKVTLADAEGRTPLHHAAEADRASIAKLLLAAGADVNAVDKTGATPVHRAAQNNPLTLAPLLAAPGVAVDRANLQGATPLALAARAGYTACVHQLLDAGARFDLATAEGATPMALATSHRRRDVHDLLAARGAAPAGVVSQAKAGPLATMPWDGNARVGLVPLAQALAELEQRFEITARTLRAAAEARGLFALDRVKAPDGTTCVFVFTATSVLSPFVLANPWAGNAGVRQQDGTEVFAKLDGVDVVGIDARPDGAGLVLRGEHVGKLAALAAAVVTERALATPQLTRAEAAVAARYFGYQQVVSTANDRPIAVAHPSGRLWVPIYTAEDTFAAAPSAPATTVNTVGKAAFDIAALDCDGAIVNPFGPTIPRILSLEAAAKLLAG